MVDDDELVKPIVSSPPLDQHSSAVEAPSEISPLVIGKDVGDSEVAETEVKEDALDVDASRKEVTSDEQAISSGFEVKNDVGDSDERGERIASVEQVVTSESMVESAGIDGGSSVETIVRCEFDVKCGGIDGDESRSKVTIGETVIMSDFEGNNDGGDGDGKGEGVGSVEVVKMEEFSPVNEELEVRNDEVVSVGGSEPAIMEGFSPVNEVVVKNGKVDGDESGKEVASMDLEKCDDITADRDELEVKRGEIDGGSSGEDVGSDEKVKTEDFTVVRDEMEVKNDDVVRDESGKEVASVEMAKVDEMEVKNDEVDGEESRPAIAEVEEESEGVKVDGEVEEDKDEVKTEEIVANENDVNEKMKEQEGEKVEKEEEVKEMEEDGEDESLPIGTTIDETKEEEVGEEEVEEMEDDKQEEEAHTEMEVEMETDTKSGSVGKRKRGRNAKATPARTRGRKIIGEDVCFICLDGGDLVLCDRRGCPKAYHPVCVDHDEEFFKTKGRWNCGWHLCNNCGKNAHFMCLTCTFSLCKGCCKDSVVFCVRGNKGFCESCMKTIMMIENGEPNEMGHAAFDDKSSWEYLFKDYWLEQKRKFSISSDELFKAKNPWNTSDSTNKHHNIEEHDANNVEETESDSSHHQLEAADSKRKKVNRKSKSENSDSDTSLDKDASPLKRKSRKKPKSHTKEVYSDSEHSSGNRDTSKKRGRKPKRLLKSPTIEGNSVGVSNRRVSSEGNVEWASKELLDFVKHMKDGDTSVLSQFDVQALLLEYIKRNRLRDPRRQSQIICDPMLQRMFGKPRVGHFEMLKLLESHFLGVEEFQTDDNHGSGVVDDTSVDADDNNNNDFIDVGRGKGKKSRKKGEERGLQSNLDDYAAIDMHNINLIYLRRNLIEALVENADTFHDKVVGSFVRIRISGSQKQDIYRLVQIIGTNKAAEAYKVGKRTTNFMLEILNLDKTENVSIDIISNQEFTEDECKRLRQSIKCGLLSRMTVGDILEKARELQEVRVNDWLEAEIVRLSHLRDRASEKGRKKELRLCVEKLQLLKTPEERQRRIEQIPKVHADPKMDPNCESEDEIEIDSYREVSMRRSRDDGSFRRDRGDHSSSRKGNDSWSANARPPNKYWDSNRDISGKGPSSRREDTGGTLQTSDHGRNNGVNMGTPVPNNWDKPRSDMSTVTTPPSLPSPAGVAAAQTDAKVNEAEKIWHYRDPAGKVQGPFSMVQLRKWSNTGYFPAELRIWKTSQGEDDSILLTDVLAGKFQKGVLDVGSLPQTPVKNRSVPSCLDTSGNALGYGSSNLPSPTPSQSGATKWSATSTNSYRSNNPFRGGNERLPSPTPTSPSSNFSKQTKDGSVVGNKVENVGASLGVVQPNMPVNQQIPSQTVPHAPNQSFPLPPPPPPPAQGFPNVGQANTGQNPSVYGHGWQSGYVARPEAVNANMTHPQLPQGQWTGAPVNNQASSYGSGYPPQMGNMTMPPSHNAWGPQPNMQWANQQQQPVNPNMGWFGPSGPGQVPPVPLPGSAQTMPPPGNQSMGWASSGPNPPPPPPPPGVPANQGRVAPPGNARGAQWNRQSSFGGSGAAHRGVCKFHENGHCRKGSACDFIHT